MISLTYNQLVGELGSLEIFAFLIDCSNLKLVGSIDGYISPSQQLARSLLFVILLLRPLGLRLGNNAYDTMSFQFSSPMAYREER